MIINTVFSVFFARNEVVFVAVKLGGRGVGKNHRHVFGESKIAFFDKRRTFHPQRRSKMFRLAVRRGENYVFFFTVSLAYEFAAFFKYRFGRDVVLPDGAVVAESAQANLPDDVIVFSPFVDVKFPYVFHDSGTFAI